MTFRAAEGRPTQVARYLQIAEPVVEISVHQANYFGTFRKR